jgi:hypothetical protein
MVPTDMYYDSVVLAKTRMHRSNTKCQAIQGSYLLINDIKIVIHSIPQRTGTIDCKNAIREGSNHRC